MVVLLGSQPIRFPCVAGDRLDEKPLFGGAFGGKPGVLRRQVEQCDIAAFFRKIKRISPRTAANVENLITRFYITVKHPASQQEFRSARDTIPFNFHSRIVEIPYDFCGFVHHLFFLSITHASCNPIALSFSWVNVYKFS